MKTLLHGKKMNTASLSGQKYHLEKLPVQESSSPSTEKRVACLAIGIFSSVFILAVIPPPASIVLTAIVILEMLAHTLPRKEGSWNKIFVIPNPSWFERPSFYERPHHSVGTRNHSIQTPTPRPVSIGRPPLPETTLHHRVGTRKEPQTSK